MPNDKQTPAGRTAEAKPGRARRQFLMLVAVFMAPLVVAYYFVFFANDSVRHSSYGELIGPVQLPDEFAGRLFAWKDPVAHTPRRWLLVDVETAPCAEACRARLEGLRQIRVATARDEDRVLRILLIVSEDGRATADVPPAPDLRVVSATTREAGRFPGQGSTADGHAYIVDTLGNVVLRYPPDLDRKRTLKDLQRLLQASSIG